MSTFAEDSHNFFRYTSGRWVWDEEDQLRERYREFNVSELQRVAMESVSASSCVNTEKVGEGSYNKSFRLTMNDGNMVIARIPNPNAGPPGLTTASEVATMDFLRNVLNIPVPKVFAWSSATGVENRVKSEYIIMEHAPGKNLARVWADMKLEHKIRTMKDIVSVQQKLLSVQFSEYGCLFYSEYAPPGSHPAEITTESLSPELVKDTPKRFSIGPVVDTAFWNKERSEMDIDRGPWRTAVDYIAALALREIAWIRKYATPRSLDDPLYISDSQNTPIEHIALLQKYLAVAPHLLPQEDDVSLRSFLWHTDLRLPNIFVDDNGNITSIIDWQSVWAGPLFLKARHPQFLNYNGEITLKLPDDFKQLDPDSQVAVEERVSKSILLYLFESYTAEKNPLLDKVFRYSNGKTRTDPIRFVGSTWDEDILPFRESLIRVEEQWDAISNQASICPIRFSSEELRRHYKDGEGWNELQDFWDAISDIMGRDGWTSHKTYDQAMSIYSQMMAEASASHSAEEE